MEAKIQLSHPEGKMAFNIAAEKYEVIRNAILQCLKGHTITHKEMLEAVNVYFKKTR